MKKFLLVGLGNPGIEYKNTRHNIGFTVLDFLANHFSVDFSLGRYANLATVSYRGNKVILIKPTTYMNLSGKAVSHWLVKEQLPLEQLLVITDDLALPFNSFKLKPKGSHGGHNGLRNIADLLQTNVYPRLRMGIGSDFKIGQQADFVLSKWTDHEQVFIPEFIQRASEAALAFIQLGLQQSMNLFNTK